jgi:hypothetical protein
LNTIKLITGIALFMLTACASSDGTIRNKLDPVTAVTITYSETPLVFYRDNSGKAAYARNFVHLAPLEVNRAGGFRYYLWLGIWNTMHSDVAGESRDGFESVVIYADGEPLPLELTGWTATAIGASEPVYLRPVSSAADAYYEVTVDHLRLITASSDIRIQSTGPRPQSYELWDEQKPAKASLVEFLGNAVY